MPDVVVPAAWQQTLQSLPEETLVFLLGSRYCETDLLSQLAWDLFSPYAPEWQRVQISGRTFRDPQNVRDLLDFFRCPSENDENWKEEF